MTTATTIQTSAWARTHEALKRAYWSIERRITPGLVSSQIRYHAALESVVGPETRWLDLGCGHQLFPDFVADERPLVARARLVVGVDPDHGAIRRHKSVTHRVAGLAPLPFQDGSFDLVTANMVVEHIEQPIVFLTEVGRVLAPGGCFLFHTPSGRNWRTVVSKLLPDRLKVRLIEVFEERTAEDVYPTHYRMNTAHAIGAAAARTGLTMERLSFLDTSTTNRIMLGPFLVLDLLAIRVQRHPRLAPFRSNIICALRRQPPAT